MRSLLLALLCLLALTPAASACQSLAPVSFVRAAANGPTVPQALDRLEAKGAIAPADHDRYRRLYSEAIATRAKLSGRFKAEQAAVVRTLDGFARDGVLTSSRVPVLFLQLQRNTEYWPQGTLPVAPQPPPSDRPCAGKAGLGGARVTFGDDPTVFQWYPGQGLQIQQLATFGKANALAKQCLPGADPKVGACHLDRVRAAANAIAALAVDRGGFRAWEYYFSFGGGRPPWVSSIATGTAIQALTRSAQALGDPSYLDVARAALGAFATKWPVGVRLPRAAGPHYLLYSFSPGLRVYNAFLQSLVGLKDFATATGDPVAASLFASGDREAQAELPGADTGAWSRYSAGGAESDAGYHRLLRDVLQALCDRTGTAAYCATATRFAGYLRQPARLALLSAGPAARVALSKISCVTLTVARGGRTVATIVRVLPRGRWTLRWSPPRKGRYAVKVQARDLVNHVTTATGAVSVR